MLSFLLVGATDGMNYGRLMEVGVGSIPPDYGTSNGIGVGSIPPDERYLF